MHMQKKGGGWLWSDRKALELDRDDSFPHDWECYVTFASIGNFLMLVAPVW